MESISITILIAIIGCIVSVGTFFLGRAKDSEKRGREDGEVKVLLNTIIKNIEDMRVDFRAANLKVDSLSERMVKVEESQKALHKRVDNLEEKHK